MVKLKTGKIEKQKSRPPGNLETETQRGAAPKNNGGGLRENGRRGLVFFFERLGVGFREGI